MAKLHRKQSKRITCRRRYTIIKKVAQHNRKLRREQKKHPKNKKQKDPGVPNSLPFKDDILREAQLRKQRAIDLKEAQKASRMKTQMKNRELGDLVEDAKRDDASFEEPIPNTDNLLKENGKPNIKSYFKEVKTVVEAADVVLEVLDARDPLGSRCPQLEDLVVRSGKKLVLVLNKIDLIPRNILDQWLKFLRQSLPTVAFKASTQTQINHLSQSKVAAIHMNKSLQVSSRCVGASFLMKVLGNYCRNQNIQTFIKVGVVGFPNVGKSSVINSLKRSRSCTVGATPGLTKAVQEVSLDKHIKIIDSPGVVIARDGSSTTLALRNVMKVETLKDVITPAEAIVKRADHTQLCLHYTIPEFSSCHELLCLLAKRMGKYKKGGIPNVEAGARRMINDWNRGIIKYYTHPPEAYSPEVYLSTCYVSELSKAFDISALEEQMELDKAPELFPSSGVIVKPSQPTDGVVLDKEEEENFAELFPSSGVIVKPSQPTDGVVSDKEEEENFEMDADEIGVKPAVKKVSFSLNEDMDEKVTVDFDLKKDSKKAPAEPKVLFEEQQKNRAMKKKFKKMKKNRRRLDKVASSLSDTMDVALTI